MTEAAGANRMSELEGLMWRLEQDPQLSSTICTISVLDRPPDLERLARRLERAAAVVPRLRQRVIDAGVPLVPPSWVDDADFSVDRHLRQTSLRGPGTLRQLLDLSAVITAEPFDTDRPLWQFVVVEGLEEGRAALVQKLHHTITDGEGGIRMSRQFLDLEREAPEPPPLAPSPPAPSAPGRLDALHDLAAESWRFTRAATSTIKDLALHPGRVPRLGLDAAEQAQALLSELLLRERARSPLWTERSTRRHIETLQVPFAPVRAASKALGGTVNDAFMTAAAIAAGEYHRRHGAEVDELRATMAVSTRTAGSGPNAFSVTPIIVPTGQLPLRERFSCVHDASAAVRTGAGAPSMSLAATLAVALPDRLLLPIARAQSRAIDFVTSNVRAAPFPLFIAGARLEANYPIGPTAGVAFNLTLMSYDGHLDMGLNTDPSAVGDPGLLRDLLQGAFAELATFGADAAVS